MWFFLDIPGYSNFFQDEAARAMLYIVRFHHDIMFYLVFIFGFTLLFLVRIVDLFSVSSPGAQRFQYVISTPFSAITVLEIVWTIIPMWILFLIAYPSIFLIYKIDTLIDPAVTIKIIGHQWYWSYESNDIKHYFFSSLPAVENLSQTASNSLHLKQLMFDAYMVPTDDLDIGQLRLLETTEALFLPWKVNVRILVTAADVIHSWAVPSLGIKVDAVPGRLNQAVTNIFRSGVFYGQCSEICGVNHGFMPIKVIALDFKTYFCKTSSVFFKN